jgi:hypothetical protein
MKAESFLEFASDPTHWRRKAESLRVSADALWDAFVLKMCEAVDKEKRAVDEPKMELATNVLRNCQFLYALSAECALKGLLLKSDPTSMQFLTKMDGSKNLLHAEILRKGTQTFDSHNLEKLAQQCGLLASGDDKETREMLSFCTRIIEWIGRYPVPLSSDMDFVPRGTVPFRAFGHYFRDFFDPFLDGVFEKLRSEPCAAPNSRPPSQLPPSPDVQRPDSQRASSSGGCG